MRNGTMAGWLVVAVGFFLGCTKGGAPPRNEDRPEDMGLAEKPPLPGKPCEVDSDCSAGLRCLGSACVPPGYSPPKDLPVHFPALELTRHRIEELKLTVVQREAPLRRRLVALDELASHGVPGALEGTEDPAGLLRVYAGQTSERLSNDDAKLSVRVAAKDAVIALLPYWPDALADSLLQEVAAFAFTGLGPQSTAQDIIMRLHDVRMGVQQLVQMREPGRTLASHAVGHGIRVQELMPYIAGATSRPSQRAAVGALGRYLRWNVDAPGEEVLKIARTLPVPETIDLCVELYQTPRLSAEMRSTALQVAYAMLGVEDVEGVARMEPLVPEDRAPIVASLEKLLHSPLAGDRWDAADLILRVGGIPSLSRVLTAFRNDVESYVYKSLQGDEILPLDMVLDMANQRTIPKPAEARPILEEALAHDDKIRRAVVLLLLKALGDPASIPEVRKLEGLTGEEHDLSSFFHGPGARGPAITVGSLATNVAEGIGMLAELGTASVAGTLTEQERKVRAAAIVRIIDATGKKLQSRVEAAAREKLEK